MKPSFTTALRFWLKLGFISFGGPAGQVAIMHQYLVQQKKWISESRFMHALNYCMLLPGPEAQQLAIYTGWLLHGLKGGLAAGVLFVLPSAFILWGLSMVYVLYGKLPLVQAVLAGLKPAVIGIILMALVRIGHKSLVGPLHYLLAIAAFAAISLFKISFLLILLATVLVGIFFQKFYPIVFYANLEQQHKQNGDEKTYFINKHTTELPHEFNSTTLLKQGVLLVTLWVLPVLLLLMTGSDFAFWKKLVLFFTQAALVTFGGAYSVLPYVAQVTVEQLHWLSPLQMMDGLALGETTPGPLIMVLAFVGFMAGYLHFGQSLLCASAGLWITTYYTFLPCFFFIFAGAPLVERSRGNLPINNLLSLITAAVVGVLLHLTFYLLGVVVIPSTGKVDHLSLLWIAISFFLLWRYQFNILLLILLSGLMGALKDVLTMIL